MKHASCDVVGVLLAAGRGRRMGTTKQLLPWQVDGRSTTVVAAAFDVIAPWCDHMIVVVGHESSAVRAALAPRAFAHVEVDPDAEMVESALAGLRAARERQPRCVLFHLADTPRTHPDTVGRLVLEVSSNSASVALPTYGGKGGHPAAIAGSFLDEILTETHDGGLKGMWGRHPQAVHRVAVDDPGVIGDLDTPEDFEDLRATR